MRTGPGASVSFEDFVRARSAALFRTALLLTGQDRAEAEDLLQGALERAYRHWGRVCRSGEPERYVRRILANASTCGPWADWRPDQRRAGAAVLLRPSKPPRYVSLEVWTTGSDRPARITFSAGRAVCGGRR
jgi:DNA-directed RNA polymerase specialized sigma24 family protein